MVLVFLFFEKVFYDKFNVLCCFIGYIMVDVMLLDLDKNVVCDVLGILYDVYCLVLLSGSCGVEVEMFSVDFLKIV